MGIIQKGMAIGATAGGLLLSGGWLAACLATDGTIALAGLVNAGVAGALGVVTEGD